MTNDLHTHNYMGKTSFQVEHTHNYSGITSSSADQPGHIHTIMGTTSLNDGHTHNYSFSTSPAIYVKGGHYHYYNAASDIAYIPISHTHGLFGYASLYSG